MPRASPMPLVLAAAALASAGALVAPAGRGRDGLAPKKWMSEAALRGTFSNATIDQMTASGSLEVRQNPDVPERKQYAVKPDMSEKEWMGEVALRSKYGTGTVDKMMANGTLKMRKNPYTPDRKQYSLKLGEASSSSGTATSASEADYQAVAQKGDDEATKEFVRRVLREMRVEVGDEGGLNGFVPWFSGRMASQSLQTLKDRVAQAWWVGPRASEADYQAVVRKGDDEATKKFVRRVLRELGLEVADEGGLSGFVPWFSGTAAEQSLQTLKDRVAQAWWVAPVAE